MNQTCYRHPTILATATCADCGQPICAACIERWRGEIYCLADYATVRHGTGRTQSHPPPSYRTVTPPGVPIATYRTTIPAVSPLPSAQASQSRQLAPLTNAAILSHQPSLRLPRFSSLIWSTLGLAASGAELVSSLLFYRLLGPFDRQRNSHDNSFMMRMTQYQAFILIFVIVLTILYSGAIMLMQRQADQPRTTLPVRRPARQINTPLLAYLFGGFAVVAGIFAIVTLLIFIANLNAIPEGLQCCG